MTTGTKAVASKLQISLEKASQIKETFKRAFPAVFSFRHQVVEDCRMHGFVETLTNRRRYFDNICSSNVRQLPTCSCWDTIVGISYY